MGTTRYYSIYIISESCPFVSLLIYIDKIIRNNEITNRTNVSHGHDSVLFYIYYFGVVPICLIINIYR